MKTRAVSWKDPSRNEPQPVTYLSIPTSQTKSFHLDMERKHSKFENITARRWTWWTKRLVGCFKQKGGCFARRGPKCLSYPGTQTR
eukprot:scaffold529_cov322-Pavlova_lutheri.AAC.1